MGVVRLRRDVGETKPPVLPLAAIVGIAVGGAVLLFGVLTAIAILCARRKHKREKSQLKIRETVIHTESKSMGNAPPSEIITASKKRLSTNPFMPLGDELQWTDWTGEDGLRSPPRRKSKRNPAPKAAFRISRMRDSWPLVSNIPMSLVAGQSSSNINVSNVAAPGHEIVPDPKWPKRALSRNSRTTISVPREIPNPQPRVTDQYIISKSPTKGPQARRPRPHLRSASENQLSTILRSTSQRLKANKNPLTRTLTTLNRPPGAPPLQPLPSLPKKKPNESQEQLVESDHDESVRSSVYDLLRSPTPTKGTPRRSVQLAGEGVSPAPSVTSEESLCVSGRTDVVIPGALTSPSKNGVRGDQRYRMRNSSGDSRRISKMIHQDSDDVFLGSDYNSTLKRSLSLTAPQRISLSSDPFFSEVKSSKPFIPGDRVLGPRPLYIRKTTFGSSRDPLPNPRPHSYTLPLQHISGNAQVSPKKSVSMQYGTPPPSDQNPFRWSIDEDLQRTPAQASPSRRRGHKRSKMVRISQLPRPISVAVVPEEPDEEPSPLRLGSLPPDSLLRMSMVELARSQSAIPFTSRQNTSRPPSSATFAPSLTDLAGRSGDNSPTLGIQELLNYCSPTLAANYYTESPITSEEEFFARASGSPISDSRSLPATPMSRKTSQIPFAETIFPSAPQQGRLVSFTSPDLTFSPQTSALISESNPPSSPRPAPRPLPRASTIYNSPAMPPPVFIKQTNFLTSTPPILKIDIPNHLTGPRAEPTKRPSNTSNVGSNRSSTFDPTHAATQNGSLQASVGILRRMNSDITSLNTESRSGSNTVSIDSTPMMGSNKMMESHGTESRVSGMSATKKDTTEEPRGRSRGSRNYLSVGSINNQSSFLLPTTSRSQVRSQAPRQRRGSVVDANNRHSQEQRNRNRRSNGSEGGKDNVDVDGFLRGRGLVGGSISPERRERRKQMMLTPVKEALSSPAGPSSEKATVPTPDFSNWNFPSKHPESSPIMLNFPTPATTTTSPVYQPSPSQKTVKVSAKPKTKAQPVPQHSANTTLFGVGELDDFFGIQSTAVDDSTFALGSGSETASSSDEDNDLKFEETSIPAARRNDFPLSQSSVPLQSMDPEVLAEARKSISSILGVEEKEGGDEESDLLELYFYSANSVALKKARPAVLTTTNHPSFAAPPPPSRSCSPTTNNLNSHSPTRSNIFHHTQNTTLTINPHAPTPARWSDATPKPPLSSISSRRESQMEYPSPLTCPPTWIWDGRGLGLSLGTKALRSGSGSGSVSPEKEGVMNFGAIGDGRVTPADKSKSGKRVEKDQGSVDLGKVALARELRGETGQMGTTEAEERKEKETEVKDQKDFLRPNTPVKELQRGSLYDTEGFYVASPERVRRHGER